MKHKIFFTGDHHFGHRNILTYCPNRVFANVDHHDASLIQVWNERVGKEDIVFHLGDFGFDPDYNTEMLKRLNGRKFLITGNHDKQNIKSPSFQSYWEKIYDTYKEIDIPFNGYHVTVVLCHYPLHSWNKSFHGSFHFHGHIHSTQENRKIPKMKYRRDVGVDTRTDCGPWEKDELLTLITQEDERHEPANNIEQFLA